MDVEKDVTGRLPEHLDDVQRVRPAIAEEFLQMFHVLIDDVLFEVRHLVRQLRTGEVEDERAVYDGHLDGSKCCIESDQLRYIVPGDNGDSPLLQNEVDFKLAFESIDGIEEFDRGPLVGLIYYAILSLARSKQVKETDRVERYVFRNPRFRHDSLRQRFRRD